jgi:hypothetical protein
MLGCWKSVGAEGGDTNSSRAAGIDVAVGWAGKDRRIRALGR